MFSSVAQSCPTLCDPMDCSTPGLPVHHQTWSSPKPMSIESAMPSNHLILCRPLPLLPSVFPTIRVFSNESALCIQHHLLQKAFPDRPPSTETVFCTTLVALWNLLALALLTGGYVHLLCALQGSEPAPPCQCSCSEDAWCLVGPWQICV